jgi:hypothetical protein
MKHILMAGSVLLLCVTAHAHDGLPEAMVGEWCFSGGVYVRGQCAELHTDGELTVTRHSYHGHEEDESWLATKVFKLVGKELHVQPIGDDTQDDL